jgi:hypothetical protein
MSTVTIDTENIDLIWDLADRAWEISAKGSTRAAALQSVLRTLAEEQSS